MHWIDLELSRALPDNEIREGFATALDIPIDQVAIVEMTRSEEEPALIPDGVQVAIDRWSQPGDFPLHLMIVVRGNDFTARLSSAGTTTRYLLAFCRHTRCDALFSCDDAGDETWLLLSHRGTTSTVVVDGRALEEGRIELLPFGATTVSGAAHPN